MLMYMQQKFIQFSNQISNLVLNQVISSSELFRLFVQLVFLNFKAICCIYMCIHFEHKAHAYTGSLRCLFFPLSFFLEPQETSSEAASAIPTKPSFDIPSGIPVSPSSGLSGWETAGIASGCSLLVLCVFGVTCVLARRLRKRMQVSLNFYLLRNFEQQNEFSK